MCACIYMSEEITYIFQLFSKHSDIFLQCRKVKLSHIAHIITKMKEQEMRVQLNL